MAYNRPQYGLAIFLDTVTNRIVILDAQRDPTHNSDPFFEKFHYNFPMQYKILRPYCPEQQRMYARLALDFLQDFILKTADLESGSVTGSVRMVST